MRYIIEGPAIGKILQENRIRIARGEIRITPLVEAVPNLDRKDAPVADSKDVTTDDTDSKKVASDTDSKEAVIDTDSKDVTTDDSKNTEIVDDETPAKAKSTKSTAKTKK